MDGQLVAGDALLKRLLAIIVNHRSGAFCERCVESLRRTWLLEGRNPADLTVVVVDTASGPAEEPWLSSIEKDGSLIVRCEKNLGYAGGMIAGYRQALKDESATDRGHEAIALLNPDLHFLTGSITPLLEELERDQNYALRIVTGQYADTPLEALGLEAGVPQYATIMDRNCLKAREKGLRCPADHLRRITFTESAPDRLVRSNCRRTAKAMAQRSCTWAASILGG